MAKALPTLVLVPGMLCDHRLFSPQVSALADCADIIVADVAQDDSITGMAMRLLKTVKTGAFVLAGLSMGGIVAMEAFRLAPERILALGLMATNHRAATPDFVAIRSEQIERVRAGGLRDIVVKEMKSHYLGPNHINNGTLLSLVVEMAMDLGPGVFERQALALVNRRDQTATLRRSHVPVTLLAGDSDKLCPVKNHVEMAGLIPNADLKIIPEAGHLLSLEAAVHVSQYLMDLLNRAPKEGITPGLQEAT